MCACSFYQNGGFKKSKSHKTLPASTGKCGQEMFETDDKGDLVHRILKCYSTPNNFKGWYWQKNKGKDQWNK